jgi:hypothetical protein
MAPMLSSCGEKMFFEKSRLMNNEGLCGIKERTSPRTYAAGCGVFFIPRKLDEVLCLKI